MMTVIVFKDYWKNYWKNSTQGQFWGEKKEEKNSEEKRKTQKVGVETRCNARQGIGIGIEGAGWAR